MTTSAGQRCKRYAVILAGGTGERTGAGIHKQLIRVAGKTVIEHIIDAFESHARIDEIVLVINPECRNLLEELILKNGYRKLRRLVNGGATRRESSAIGINAITDGPQAAVLVHDGARPFLSRRIIDRCLDALAEHDAVDVAVPSPDTLIRVDEQGFIEEVPRRALMRRGQTPQAFRLGVIRRAHELAAAEGSPDVTDDCGLVLRYDLSRVFVVGGDEQNIKITYPLDLYVADRLFHLRSSAVPAVPLERLEGKVLAVFGGTRGIGKSIVKLAEAHGATARAWSRRTGVDVRSLEQVERALECLKAEAGSIDYVVDTAAMLGMGSLESRPIDEIRQEIEANYLGAIHVARAGFQHLERTRGSLLLFTSSSYTRGRALYAVYSSTKAAVVNLVQALAQEWTSSGVRINAINPERTATPMRWEAFGREPSDALLDPERVAVASLKTLLSTISGEVIDVRK